MKTVFFEHLRNNNEIICDLVTAIQSVELEDCVRKSIPIYEKYKYSKELSQRTVILT